MPGSNVRDPKTPWFRADNSRRCLRDIAPEEGHEIADVGVFLGGGIPPMGLLIRSLACRV
jgi:hypothetical protein